MKHSNITVAALGEVLWDMLPEGKRLGGAPANFAYHVSSYGIETAVISAVGMDELGSEALETMNARHLGSHIARLSSHPTGTVKVTLDKKGIPSYKITENAAWDFIPWSSRLEELAAETDAVCFGTLAQRSPTSRRTIRNFLEAMPHDNRHLRIFDVNLRTPYWDNNIVAESLQNCNILKLNDEELPIVASAAQITANAGNPVATARSIMEKYALRAIILTCGATESYIFTPEEESRLATPHVKVADTVGAGDSFTAAFTATILLGHTVAQAHEAAVERAAYVCTQHGATPPVP